MGAEIIAWLAQNGAKIAFSLLITLLEKSGILNGVEASAARAEHAFVGTVSHLKTYSEYPAGVNGQTANAPVSIQEWRNR